ncbi:hypothetical protein [Streptomyces sp. NPDC058718]|uniref:hypothetical protein n=1 Tax=Streptomyces sp. NPDC058718 TaxID=3346610 RepID=UPI0036CE0409
MTAFLWAHGLPVAARLTIRHHGRAQDHHAVHQPEGHDAPRHAGSAALAAGAAVPLAAAVGPAWAAQAAPALASAATRLGLPGPTGPYPVGTVQLHLVDRSRVDGIAGPGHFRELVAALWYPARNVERSLVASWTPAGAFQAFLADAGSWERAEVLARPTANHGHPAGLSCPTCLARQRRARSSHCGRRG